MKKNKLIVLVNELKNVEKKIKKYIEFHANPFDEVVKDLEKKPIGRMRIFIHQNKLVMLLEVDKNFDIKNGIHIEPQKEKIKEWQKIMGSLFQELETGEISSWEETDLIFDTKDYY
ncbi:MAG: L-rhamnose mutarotase [Chloroflexota bacterium]|nr:L-rhamnose mutarotase [Chloroflexota bacterium]